MAGLGRKVFVAGEVLEASEVNGYLMDQAVMVFADSAARTAAIPSPTEGMLTYLQDVDALQVFTGSEFEAIGGGASGAGGAINLNNNEITADYTFDANTNGVSAGPITIASGVTVTVGATSAWSIV